MASTSYTGYMAGYTQQHSPNHNAGNAPLQPNPLNRVASGTRNTRGMSPRTGNPVGKQRTPGVNTARPTSGRHQPRTNAGHRNAKPMQHIAGTGAHVQHVARKTAANTGRNGGHLRPLPGAIW